MSVPVTKLFVQYVYIGAGMVAESTIEHRKGKPQDP